MNWYQCFIIRNLSFLSISDSDRRVPAGLGQESQESSCLRKGTPLASRGAQDRGFPGGSAVNSPPANTGNKDLISGPEDPTYPGATKPMYHNY